MLFLVTGASSGYGSEIARRAVADGHRVIAAGRRTERLQQLREELGSAVLPFTLDVRDRAATEALIAALPAEWRDIDVLVNNAGLALGLEPAHQAHLDDWDAMIRTNVMGLTCACRAACARLARAVPDATALARVLP